LKGSQGTPAGRTPPPKEPLLPPGYRIDYSDPNVLTLLSPQDGAVVARFSARGYLKEMIEREAWEHYGQNGTRPTT
jgi:hypothetical protein